LSKGFVGGAIKSSRDPDFRSKEKSRFSKVGYFLPPHNMPSKSIVGQTKYWCHSTSWDGKAKDLEADVHWLRAYFAAKEVYNSSMGELFSGNRCDSSDVN